MCPSFKATGDVRQSPKGRADALRAWHEGRRSGEVTVIEGDLLGALDTCLGCKACTSTCPVQVDIPAMRAAFYAEYYARRVRPLSDRTMLLAERLSPWLLRAAPLLRLGWPLVRRLAERVLNLRDLPADLARPLPRAVRISPRALATRSLPERSVLVWMDWFSSLYDEATQRDVLHGLSALGYNPLFVDMRPTGKVASDLGDCAGFLRMGEALCAALRQAAARRVPMIGFDPAFVMALRQDYRKAGLDVPEVLLPQEFLAAEIDRGVCFPRASGGAVNIFTHCTESAGAPKARSDWKKVMAALGLEVQTPTTGCCGMAGMFGHKTRHQDMSRKLFALSWVQLLTSENDATATGFSCRCQAERVAGRALRHPLGLIAQRIGSC